MQIVHSDDHQMHFPNAELYNGQLVRPFECPERIDYIIAALAEDGMADVVAPAAMDLAHLSEVHDAGYVNFLQTAWAQWAASPRWADGAEPADMIPTCFPTRRMNSHVPVEVEGQLGWYAFAAETAITAGTWQASLAAASCARSAQQNVAEGASRGFSRTAFALCRPPGHHAGRDYFGGYCFLNNAAVAAQGFLADGAERIAVLDVDFHHGNGTQDIFYERDDVFFASLHGDPSHEFPYFTGHGAEMGAGVGHGYNANYPLAPGADFATWMDALKSATKRIVDFGPDALVISLGVDTFVQDPISSFLLSSDDFRTYGHHLGGLGLPTVYCMEGGYAVEQIGINVANVLSGHLDQ